MSSSDGMSEIGMDETILNREFNFVEFYAEFFKKGNYIYSISSSTWYVYYDFTVLLESKTKNPIFLKVDVCRTFD